MEVCEGTLLLSWFLKACGCFFVTRTLTGMEKTGENVSLKEIFISPVGNNFLHHNSFQRDS